MPPTKKNNKSMRKKQNRNKKNKKQTMSVAKVAKIAKKTMIKQVESKRVDYGYARFAAYHNGGTTGINGCPIYFLTDTAYLPMQGTGDSQRIGNDIYAIGWTLRFQINIPSDRLNTKFRVMVLRVNKGYSVSGYTNIFDNITGNIMLDPVDKDRIKVLKTLYVGAENINPGVPTTGKEITLYRKIFIPFNKTIKFYDDGTQQNNLAYDYYLITCAYDTYGSLNSDIVGYIQPWLRLTYKDL